jgi:hypothetical protein
MIEIKIPHLSGTFRLSGLLMNKDCTMVQYGRGLNLWLNPYFSNGQKMPNDNEEYVGFGFEGERTTRVYTQYMGESVKIKQLFLSIKDDSILGPTYFGYIIKNENLSNNGWQILELHEGGASTL